MSLRDDDLDANWFYDQIEKSAIKMPSEEVEDDFLYQVRVNVGKGMSIHHARVKAFTMVVLK